MLKTPLLAGAAALALLPLSATAQDHSGHDPHAGHVMPAAEPKAADPVDHSAMDHGTMDHGAMDHSSPATPPKGQAPRVCPPTKAATPACTSTRATTGW